jgi:hypothetical protein
VVSGLKQLEVNAQVAGIKAPKLSVRSNLDEAIAQRLKAWSARRWPRRRARGPGGQPQSDKVEPVKRRSRLCRPRPRSASPTSRPGSTRRGRLQAQLKRLTAGLAPGINLPKIKL